MSDNGKLLHDDGETCRRDAVMPAVHIPVISGVYVSLGVCSVVDQAGYFHQYQFPWRSEQKGYLVSFWKLAKVLVSGALLT